MASNIIGSYEDELIRRNAELEARTAASLAAADAVLLDQERRLTQAVGEPSPFGAMLSDEANYDTILQASAEWPQGDDGYGAARLSTEARGGAHVAGGGAAMPPEEEDFGEDEAPAAQERPGTGRSTGMGDTLDVPGNQEATVRLLKAKNKALEEELSHAHGELGEHRKELLRAQKEAKDLAAEKLVLQKAAKQMEAQIDKYRKAADSLAASAAEKEREVAEVEREVDRVHRERKAQEADVRSRDVRLNRALEEVEKYKRVLQESKMNERDGKDGVRRDLDRLAGENKKLERQKAELLAAFRKQMKLVDVLKKQKIHLEAARVLTFTEAEFMKTLDQGA
eukprot:CAMPEP_0182885954 /NCGR_PEP_ID=MMETSP0034_2-20130328/19918_1 /TAXON_ID=156128 /ORGANISM="Nephroselmis pyriformis, Strain CCMP717" /LENGTH=338 /DNA_ID=CAMNT_0025019243 /DNA_START=37 /DNA_END=1053 /DNA_ORIENTATION=+